MSKPVIIVTGASRGIGEAIVKKLTASATVIGVSRSEAPLKAMADKYADFRYVAGDVTDEHVCKKVIDQAVNDYKRIDGIVFNAGVLEPVTRLADASVKDWKQLYDINLFSIVGLLSKSIPYMRESKGRVVFVCSGASKSFYLAWGAYGSSKAAVRHLAGTLAAEEKDIFSIAIDPGVVDTEMQTGIRNNHKEAMGSNHNKFIDLKNTGALLPPDVPASFISNLALKGQGDDINGKGFRYNAPELASYSE